MRSLVFSFLRALPGLGLLAAAIPTSAAATEVGEPLHAATPWVTHAGDEGEPRSLIERVTGVHVDPEDYPEPYADGTMVFDAESFNVDTLASMGLPALPALDFDPTPGVLYLEMNGVQLAPTCPKAQPANAALNCSPLVDKVTDFPAYGSSQQQAALYQKLSTYYADFNLVIATQRPPDYLPYTMAVVGGSSGNAGQSNGVCGIANVACDGAKRNHVSLSFPSSCNGVADIAAQETAHNWGLEHTEATNDLMYPYANGGAKAFRDQCMDISHATGSGVTQCTYVHKLYCPDGGGEQQNSHAELLGIFGPRVADTEKPQILSIAPEDGAVFTTADSFSVTADLADNFNMLGVKWTWTEGVPEDIGDTYTKCTNKVCDDEFIAWKSIDTPWDFVSFTKPPAGVYSFKLEVMDAYGNYSTKTITVTVQDGGTTDGTTTGGTDGTTGGTTDGTTGGTTDGTGGETTGGGTTEGTGGTTGGSGVTGGTSVTGSATNGETFGGDGDDEEGCACQVPTSRGAPALLGIFALAALGRRRRRGVG
ncbi:MAG: MYXO-CTERM sorting domain-containing protein [Nannocystaceae bacterium]